MSSSSGFNYWPQGKGDPRYAISQSGNNHPTRDDCEPSSGRNFNQPPLDYSESRHAIHQDYREPRYAINVMIMVSALIVLLLVVMFVLFLHLYARRLWRQSARLSTRRSASTRGQLHFIRQEPARLLNVGLDPAILETLPMFLYKPQDFTDGLDCAVCLCEFQENEKARLLPNCRHFFHVECIDMWFNSHSTCPVCRTGAQPERPVLESIRIEQVLATIPGPNP